MKKLFTLLVAVALGLQVQVNAQKYKIVEPNESSNPTIADLDEDGKLGNDVFGGDYIYGFGQDDPEIGFWDQTVSHTDDGSGSWRMGPEIGGSVAFGGRIVIGKPLPVKVGDEVTFTIYAKATNFPAPTMLVKLNCYKKDYGSYWQYGDLQSRLLGAAHGTFTEPDVWQEFVVSATIVDTTIAYVMPYILFEPAESGRTDKLDGVQDYSNYGYVYIDDVYVSKQRIGFNEMPSSKNAFEGADVKIDSVGNIMVKNESGTYDDFFPMAVCGAEGRDASGYQNVYGNQGFNMEARAWSVSRAQEVVNGGMFYGFDFTKYIDPDQGLDLAEIGTTIASLQSNEILDKCIFYYIDNETVNNYQRVKDVTDAIRAADPNRPIYMNCGMYPEDARRYANDVDPKPLIDMAGAYVGNGDGAYYDGARRIIIGNNIEKLSVPFNIAHIQEGVGTAFRATLYAAIANGAKGFIFWKDKYDDGYSIEDYPWWNDLPTIKTEIDQMMAAGIVQAPEADWSISFPTDTVTILEWGARQVNGKNYLILSNLKQSASYDEYGDIVLTPEDVTTTVTLNGLSGIVEVKDFFTGDVVTSVSGNSFDVTLPANTAVVYELSDGTSGINDIESRVSVYPNPTQGNITIEIEDGTTQIVTITNITGSVIKQQQVQGRAIVNIADQPNGVYFVKVGNKITKVILSK